MVVTTNAIGDPSIENKWAACCTNKCALPEEDHCAYHLG